VRGGEGDRVLASAQASQSESKYRRERARSRVRAIASANLLRCLEDGECVYARWSVCMEV